MNKEKIYFPVDQKEQAAQSNENALLGRDIFHDLVGFLDESITNQQNRNNCSEDEDDVDSQRSHNAILIDGGRGTGKSSVLVNLPLYLKNTQSELYNKLLIVKPVDPTLLESNDDLFLNVIVAAIIRDKSVSQALDRGDRKAEAFHHQLQKLGSALESLQLQSEQYGLDKLRAFLGNHGLMQQVHVLFKKTLELVGKELLVLPIDDVDTSLNRAFENLEVVRKYLTSPYVLPIISGDLSLYHEVTWRDFHYRLLKDSKAESDNAIGRAKELAFEYERKVLPLQYRRTMPEVSSYMRQRDIILGEQGQPFFSMYTFVSWLEALLNERTNGFENSHLELPINNIRELSQLVFAFKELVPQINNALNSLGLDDPSASMIRRMFIMPLDNARLIKAFRREYNEAQWEKNKSARETGRNTAYKNFFDTLNNSNTSLSKSLDDLANSSKRVLLNHLKYDYKAGSVCLTLMADAHINHIAQAESVGRVSVFDTPLFQPLQNKNITLRVFQKNKSITSWRDHFTRRVPQGWLNNLPSDTIVAYPIPEVGYATTHRENELPEESQLLVELLLHRNFYSINKKADLLCCGRIFELVITSFVKNITSEDVAYIIQHAPFYSFSNMASTKAMTIEKESSREKDKDNMLNEETDISVCISLLVDDINEWRKKHRLVDKNTSAWLIYNVMNKFFSQVGLFNSPLTIEQAPKNDGLRYLFQVARKAYRSLWAAFGSFEKGSVFGFPQVISSVNIGDGDKFENSDLYRQNISPFLHRPSDELSKSFGGATGSYTAALFDHPLKDLIDRAYSNCKEGEDKNIKEVESSTKGYKNNARLITEIIKKYLQLVSIDKLDSSITLTDIDIDQIREKVKSANVGEDELAKHKHYNSLLTMINDK